MAACAVRCGASLPKHQPTDAFVMAAPARRPVEVCSFLFRFSAGRPSESRRVSLTTTAHRQSRAAVADANAARRQSIVATNGHFLLFLVGFWTTRVIGRLRPKAGPATSTSRTRIPGTRSIIPSSDNRNPLRRFSKSFGKERFAQRCGASEAGRDAVRKAWKSARRVVSPAPRTSSRTLADAPHRPRARS